MACPYGFGMPNPYALPLDLRMNGDSWPFLAGRGIACDAATGMPWHAPTAGQASGGIKDLQFISNVPSRIIPRILAISRA